MLDGATDISSYRLTIIAAIVVLALSFGLIIVIAPNQAAQYGTLISTIAIPGLFALFKLEQNSKQSAVQHTENREALSKLVKDNQAIGDAIKEIHANDLPIEQAALKVSEILTSDTAESSATTRESS